MARKQIEQVLILNSAGGIVFQGVASLTNIEKDSETHCLTTTCRLSDGVKLLVWHIDDKWQGWLH